MSMSAPIKLIMDQIENVRQQLTMSDSNKLVLAYSGGVDSEVLAYALSQYRLSKQHSQQLPSLPILLVHVHHGLSANADVWGEHCQNRAALYQLPIVVEHLELTKMPRQSLEAIARDGRYQAIAKHLNQGDVLLTAHHQDDQLETILLALKRGQGPKGLAAMGELQPFMPKHKQLLWHARPMLGLSRLQIEQLAEQNGLIHIEDESNADDQFDRNFLRNQIIPQLKQRWPSIAATAARSAALCHDSQLLIDDEVSHRLPPMLTSTADAIHYRTESTGLKLDSFFAQDACWQAHLLRAFLIMHQVNLPSQVHLTQLISQFARAKNDANIDIVIADKHIKRFEQHMFVVNGADEKQVINRHLAHEQGLISALRHNANVTPTSTVTADFAGNAQGEYKFGQHWLAWQFAQTGPRLRLPQQGEQVSIVFAPSGKTKCRPVFATNARNKPRELKKLWQECHIPPWRRRNIAAIYYNDNLVAMLGLWIEKDFLAQQDDLGLSFTLL
ncbi:tRNA lysidine(34) synthetase TilS [Shewanella intestini]|uniref:tRNA(Ile)-lysidine synthase n=1 Tax=Shewanella intestini TaxID=2017544 RepID=A0ABS5HYE8_9GAMM|nr:MULTISPECIES: tRNA lysidine(34) synthetase TilS [Shewanella]MBR9726804.1 tRNA lysidine(34) synthetase TilS [Shewanella intestini]MRG34630.1 tRNA lysidine(34) synthetase TilS [Shewanella sp. XMDDZSB0408]